MVGVCFLMCVAKPRGCLGCFFPCSFAISPHPLLRAGPCGHSLTPARETRPYPAEGTVPGCSLGPARMRVRPQQSVRPSRKLIETVIPHRGCCQSSGCCMEGDAPASLWLVCVKGHFFLHLQRKEIIACKCFSGTDFLLERAADSAPAVHIVGYREAGPAFAPDVAPWRGGRSPPVFPPPPGHLGVSPQDVVRL